MARVSPLEAIQMRSYNAAPARGGGITFMPPAGMRQAAPRRAAAAPVAQRRAAQGMSLADRILASEEQFQQAALEPAEAPDGGFKEDAVRGLGWIVGNPVSKAILKPLEVLDYGRAAVGGSVRQLLDTQAMEDLNQAIADYTPLKYSPIKNKEYDPGWDWGELWSDIKKREGGGTSVIEPAFGKEGTDRNIWARRALGFGFDVGTDPLAFLSGGTRAGSGVASRMTYLNKLQDAQNLAKGESLAAREAADVAGEWARLMGGTGADEAAEFTAGAAAQAEGRLAELAKIGDKDAIDLIRKRGVNIATPEQMRAMGVPQHAVRLSGVPIQDVLAGPVRMFDRGAGDALARGVERVSEPVSRAMSRFLSPGKEVWSQTAGRQARKIVTPRGVMKQSLGPATERLLTDTGTMSREVALRAFRVNENMRLAIGDFRAPTNQFLHQLGQALKGVSDDDSKALIKAAEELGEDNVLTEMPQQVLEVMKKLGLDPPELKPWMLPNGKMSKYVMPHVLSRDSFRFFNKVKKGENPALDFIRRDMGIHDKDLLEEGGFLQRRVFRPNADGSPATFKIGEDEITIKTGSVAELEEQLGGLLRQHGFEGQLYEQSPVEAWRRYINSTEKDVAKRVAEIDATTYGLPGVRYKGAKPKSYDPYGREVENLPAPGETEPRWTRAKSTERAPTGDDVWEYVEDAEATKARNEIIAKGGDKNVHAQVLGEFEDTAAAARQTLAQDIEGTRQHAEQAFDLAREKSAKNLARAEKIVATRRTKVARLEAEYKELLKEASANEQLIAANKSTIHGVRSQTPKKIKAAIALRLKVVAEELEHERGRLDSLEAGLKHALEGREQREADELLERFVGLQENMMNAEKDLAKMKERARKAVAGRIRRESSGEAHLITDAELADANAVLNDLDAEARALELQTRQKNLAAQIEARRNEALELNQQAQRIEEQLGRKTGGTTPRTEARQARMEAADQALFGNARELRNRAANIDRRANELERSLANTERRLKADEWLKAQDVVEQHAGQQNQIDNFLNPTSGIDVRAEKIRLDSARREIADFVQERKDVVAQKPKTPLQQSEARMAEAIGSEPIVEFNTSQPDDLPGGEEGLHRLLFSTEGAPPKAAPTPSALPEWMQGSTPNARTGVDPTEPEFVSSLIWSAKTGEVMMISVDPNFQRRGIATAMFDYGDQYAKEHGLQSPKHSGIQTEKGKAWAPEADKQIEWWTREGDNTKGLLSYESEKARQLIDSPEAREYAADESLAYGLRQDIDRIENPSEAPGFVEWTEVGRKKPAAQPRKNRTWEIHDARRRSLAGEMEAIREEAYFTKPGMGEGEFYRRPKPRVPGSNEPKWMEGYRQKPSTRRLRGKEPWWTEVYPQRIDQSSSKASRTRRLKALQKELDKEDAWLAKNPKPPHPKPNPRGVRFRAKINGKIVRVERGATERVWRIITPDGKVQTFNGGLADAWREAERVGKEVGKTPRVKSLKEILGPDTRIERNSFEARDGGNAGHRVFVSTPESHMLGSISWEGEAGDFPGEISSITVNEKFQRKGIATSLLDEARRIAGEEGWPEPIHAPTQTKAGRAWKEAAEARLASPDTELNDLRRRLAGAEARMREADKAALPLPNRQEWEQPYSQSWWRDSRDAFNEALNEVRDRPTLDMENWETVTRNNVEDLDNLTDSELVGLIQDEWRNLTPDGQARMRELGWERGQAPYNPVSESHWPPAGNTVLPEGWVNPNAPPPLSQRIKEARSHLATAAHEQGTLPDDIVGPRRTPPNPEDYIHERFDPKIAEAQQRIGRKEQYAEQVAGPEALEAIRSRIQGRADTRIGGMQAENESLRFQNERLGEMMTDLYDTRMPDPVADWQKAYDNAEAARTVHQSIVDYIEKYAVRQRAIDMVEKNRRAGAPTIKDLERVAERQMRPEDAQGLMRAVDDVNKFMTNADQILPVRTRKQIEAALMAHEQALAALTTTNDLPARALADMQKAAKSGDLPKVLKAQLRDAWREVGQDGDIIIDKELQRAWFGVEEVLDSKVFGRLFTTWTNFFKTYATLTPGFHVRNAISAIFMNATEGVGVREQLRAIRLWKQYRAAKDPLAFLAGLPAHQRNAFRATFASGPAGQFLEAGVGTARAGAGRAKERLFANPATRLSKNLGEWVEGPQRLALGLHTTQAGGTVGEALNRISRIHFDYAQVSKFDEQAKRLIPFWTFMSRNVPLQFTQMWMKPNMYLRYQSFARNMQLGNEEHPVIPSYIRQAGGLDIGVKTPDLSGVPVLGKLAPPAGMPVVLQPDLPQNRYYDDLQRVTNALSGQGVGQMATNLNPMITVPAEFAGRTDFFTGQNFPNEASVKVGGAATPWAMALSAIGQARKGADGSWYIDAAALNAIRGLDPNLDRMLRLLPQAGGLETTDKTGASTTARQAESWARYMGLPVRTITPQQQRSETRNQFFKQRERRLEKMNSGG